MVILFNDDLRDILDDYDTFLPPQEINNAQKRTPQSIPNFA